MKKLSMMGALLTLGLLAGCGGGGGGGSSDGGAGTGTTAKTTTEVMAGDIFAVRGLLVGAVGQGARR